MADFIFNVAKGKVAYYAGLPGSTDSLEVVLLEAAGLDADSALIDMNTLGDILDTNTEQTAMGRKTLASVAATVNDTSDRAEVDADDPLWETTTGDPVGKLLVCYKPDSAAVDDDIIPLLAWDLVFTPGTGDLLTQFNAAGFFHATGA